MMLRHLHPAALRPSALARGLRVLCGLSALSALATPAAAWSPAATSSSPATNPSPYYNEGRRWIGVAKTCVAPSPWSAERLFPDTPGLPADLTTYCIYSWKTVPVPPAAPPPTLADIQSLAANSNATELTEDVPVVFPQGESSAIIAAHLRGALAAHVGTSALLPPSVLAGPTPAARIVVVDSAPDSRHGAVVPGNGRHGDTLAHLIEDIVCDGGLCAAEVTTALALPWDDRGVYSPEGGLLGTPTDLAAAVFRALDTWQSDLALAPATTPPKLVLNLSVGWEDTAFIADCSADDTEPPAPPARAVIGILRHAAAMGALVVTAAGNDSGGPAPRTGLLCPGRFQGLPRVHGASGSSLVIAASGVDYADEPLETARPQGTTALVGLGLGGVAWNPLDSMPPALTGSSVSAAVVSAVSALVWAYDPTLPVDDLTAAVHTGGAPLGPADDCPRSLGQTCLARRVSTCGALLAAGMASSCKPALPLPGSQPFLAGDAIEALYLDFPGEILADSKAEPTVASDLPRYAEATVQSAPWVFPQPVVPTCPMCVVITNPYVQTSTPELYASPGQDLSSVNLVVLSQGVRSTVRLASLLEEGVSYRFTLPGVPALIDSAYITGYAGRYSITEQILVQR